MALTKCKECGNDVSQKATQCPKCGSPVKKKTSIITWIFAIFLGLWFIGFISGQSTSSTPTPAAKYEPSPKEKALAATELEFSWGKTGFGSIMEANFTIKNNSDYNIKDIEIECEHTAKSGTKIDSNSKTIYDVVNSKSKKKFNNFNMGFIHSQVNSSSCRISDLKIE